MRELSIRYDSGDRSSILLDRDRFLVGRSSDVDLWCPRDPALSRRQFLLERDGEEWIIEDQGSKNGTLVNGVPLSGKRQLLTDDVIVAGHLVLVYRESVVQLAAPSAADGQKSLLIPEEDLDATLIRGTNRDIAAPLEPGLAAAPEFPATGLGWLEILNGPQLGKRRSLTKDFMIGRDSECDLSMNDKTVSRHHARVVLENKRFFLYSMGANGTFLNGMRIGERQELYHRDELQIGTALLRFIQPISPDEVTPAGKKRAREFEQVWKELSDAARVDAPAAFMEASRKLIADLLCDALGLVAEGDIIPYRNGITGYMVQAPTLRIRKPHFPVLIVSYDESVQDLRRAVQAQLARARAADYFVLFIVVPVRNSSVDGPDKLREKLVDRVDRQDLVVLDQDLLAELIVSGSPDHLLRIILRQGIELAILSPYIAYGPVSDLMFFGREKEIKLVKQTIQSGNYAVVGGRRIGKSSIIQKLARLLNLDARHFSAVQINCEGIGDYKDFFEAIAQECTLSASEPENPMLFRKMVMAIKQRVEPASVVFLMDEVDRLLDFDATRGTKLFTTFRALSHDARCRFVFSGSRTLYQHLRNPNSPFFNFCEHMVLGPLDRESLAMLVSGPLMQWGIILQDRQKLIERVIDITSCHPNLAQWLCDRLLKMIKNPCITLDNVEEIISDRPFLEHYVQTAWGDADPLERLISLVMRDPVFDHEDVIREVERFGIADRAEIQQALEMLQLRILLTRESRQYRFRLGACPRNPPD